MLTVKDKILVDTPGEVPELELWSAVILQALINVQFEKGHWGEDLLFISGAGNWDWICEQLGMDARRASKMALQILDDNFKKH